MDSTAALMSIDLCTFASVFLFLSFINTYLKLEPIGDLPGDYFDFMLVCDNEYFAFSWMVLSVVLDCESS